MNATDAQIAALPAAGAAADEVVFAAAPKDLSALAEHAPTMPAVMLPESLRPWIEDVCNRMRVPFEMVAAPCIVAAAALVGRRRGIRPKAQDDWTVVPNLWGCVVAPPGMLKSPALSEALRPFHRLVAAERERWKHDERERAERRTLLELEIAAFESRLKAAHKPKSSDDATALGAELIAKRQELEALTATESRFETSDATTEKLGELLLQNPNGLLLHRDELVGWLRTLEKPGREGDRQFYLEAWNGTNPFHVDRIGRGSLYIPALCVSIIGTTQPGPLRSYVREACCDGSGADGLLQRVQVVVWPDEFPAWQYVDVSPDTTAKAKACDAFQRLCGLDVSETAAEVDPDGVPFVRFNNAAQAVFAAWQHELEVRLRSDDLASQPAFAAHLAKYRSLMPTLALLFALLDDPVCAHVSERAACLAADWCEFLEAHAKKIYAEGGCIRAARCLAEHVEDGDLKHGDTVRGVYRRGWSGLGTSEAVESAARLLEPLHWLRIVKVAGDGGPGRRPSPVIALHPSFRSRTKGNN